VTIPPVVTPLLQWVDANGKPYANGTITTYIPGTGTPKTTWVDPDGAFANENPLTLDVLGRSQMWGDGAYRLVVADVLGNPIADITATTLVSAAMYPVVNAPTIEDALDMLGVNTAISDEAAARAAADAAETNARIAEDTYLQSEITNLQVVVDTVNNNLGTEINRAVAAETDLQTQVDTLANTVATGPVGATIIQGGIATLDIDGHFRVTFPTPFPTAWISFTATIVGIGNTSLLECVIMFTADVFGADVYMMQNGILSTQAIPFCWTALGH
jgi:hypothetical protein